MSNLTNTSEDELNAKYEFFEGRIINEINRIKLPAFVEALKSPGYVKNLLPLSQRRILWNVEQQSRLIESFIANIPVPPLVFYESEYKSYEVLDGQQRISTIQAFYENKLRLRGLELWSELNGYTYADLSYKIRTVLDRRSVSYIALITQADLTTEEALQLKQVILKRLNIGRVNKEEIRDIMG